MLNILRNEEEWNGKIQINGMSAISEILAVLPFQLIFQTLTQELFAGAKQR